MSRTLPRHQFPPIPPDRLREVAHQARNRATVALLMGKECSSALWMRIAVACETRLAAMPLERGAEVGRDLPPLALESIRQVEHRLAPDVHPSSDPRVHP